MSGIWLFFALLAAVVAVAVGLVWFFGGVTKEKSGPEDDLDE